MRRGGEPVAASAALARAGLSRRTAAAIRAGRRYGPDSRSANGCQAPANSAAGAVTAAASHSGVIIR